MSFKTITVADLIDLLQDQDPDARVIVTCDYGDHSHTEQALAVRTADETDEHALVKTAYSSSGYAIDQEQEDGGASVVVLRSSRF